MPVAGEQSGCEGNELSVLCWQNKFHGNRIGKPQTERRQKESVTIGFHPSPALKLFNFLRPDCEHIHSSDGFEIIEMPPFAGSESECGQLTGSGQWAEFLLPFDGVGL